MNRLRCLKSKLWPFHAMRDVRSYLLASHATNSRVALPGFSRRFCIDEVDVLVCFRVIDADEPDDTRIKAVGLDIDEQRTILCCRDSFVRETDDASLG